MADTFLKYALYVGLGFGGLFFVLIILTLVEKPYRRRRRGVAESNGPTSRDRVQPVEDSPEQTAE